MWLVINGAFAFWVYIDAKERRNHAVGWTLATLFTGFIFLSIYLAERNLKKGETREGGSAWNILKNLALF